MGLLYIYIYIHIYMYIVCFLLICERVNPRLDVLNWDDPHGYRKPIATLERSHLFEEFHVCFPCWQILHHGCPISPQNPQSTFPISPGPSEGAPPCHGSWSSSSLRTRPDGFRWILAETRLDFSLMGLAWLSNPPGWKSKIMCKIMSNPRKFLVVSDKWLESISLWAFKWDPWCGEILHGRQSPLFQDRTWSTRRHLGVPPARKPPAWMYLDHHPPNFRKKKKTGLDTTQKEWKKKGFCKAFDQTSQEEEIHMTSFSAKMVSIWGFAHSDFPAQAPMEMP